MRGEELRRSQPAPHDPPDFGECRRVADAFPRQAVDMGEAELGRGGTDEVAFHGGEAALPDEGDPDRTGTVPPRIGGLEVDGRKIHRLSASPRPLPEARDLPPERPARMPINMRPDGHAPSEIATLRPQENGEARRAQEVRPKTRPPDSDPCRSTGLGPGIIAPEAPTFRSGAIRLG